MKKTWLILMSMMLLVAFSTSAFAVDVKFSGEYLAGGMYLDKTSLRKGVSDAGPSTAFYFQRLRVKTDFIVSPGLTLTTRFDAMERAWGAARTAPGTAADVQSQGTVAENENIAFDMAYLTYASPYGILSVGYQPESGWGTVFGNSSTSAGKISYTLPVGDFIFIVQLAKLAELSNTAKYASTTASADFDALYLMAMYKFKYGIVGLANFILENKTTRQTLNYKTSTPLYLAPYINAKFGPVGVQAELLYQRGKRIYEVSGVDDIDISALAGWIDVVADFGMFYAGGTFAYVSGDDPGTTNKIEGGSLSGGNDFNPCLILWNYDRAYWAGALQGHGAATASGANMTNGYLYLLKAGVKPVDKLDIMGSAAYARADQQPTGFIGKEYGWELDLTATYKITNNLSYMLGVGYLFSGDYFKGTSTSNELNNDFLVINKLTLTF